MNSTSRIVVARRARRAASIALTALLLSGHAGADELMLSEITVIALALDTQVSQRESMNQSIDDALDSVREQIRVDTRDHLELTIAAAEERLSTDDAS